MIDAKTTISSSTRPQFLWWRFTVTVAILAAFGWGFSASWFCEPAPSGREQVVLVLLLLVILVQTFQADWYRNDSPRELVVFEGIVLVLKVLAIIAAVAIIVVAILSLIPDPLMALLVIVAAALATLALIYYWDSVA